MSALHTLSHRPSARLMAALALCLAPAAQAAAQSFTGQFAADDDLAIFAVDLPVDGSISARTWSYSGGVNAAGTPVAADGFAPVLTLFGPDGFAFHGNVGSHNTCAGVGSACWDAQFSAGLQAGHYLLVLSQDDNHADTTIPITAGTATGAFGRAGQPHYTAQYLGSGANGTERFVQADMTLRSGNWALDIDVAGTVTQVPEPGTWLLWLAGLAALGAGATGRPRQRPAAVSAPGAG